MDAGLLVSGSVLAAVVAGTIALLAPCCFSVMLPAYFAGSVQNRRALVGMTIVYALGVATVILPLALGAVALRRVLVEEHTLLYVGGGLLMVALAVHVLLGGEMKLPMPSRRAGSPTGPAGVYGLGVFSGIASSCCAPVLAGVVALAGISGSLPAAAGLGGAYVFGMVAPLFLMAAMWDRYGDRFGRLLRPRSFTWRIGPLRRTISGAGLATGLLLLLIGAGMMWTGLAGRTMAASDGWQADLLLSLQRAGRSVTDALAFVPQWLVIAVLMAAAVWIARTGWRQLRGPSLPDRGATEAAPQAQSAQPESDSCCVAPDPEETSHAPRDRP